MDPQGNNFLNDQFSKLLEIDSIKLGSFTISLLNNDLVSMHGMYMGPPSANIEIVFYINQMSTNKNIHEDLEKHMASVLQELDAVFTGRVSQVEIHRRATITYKIKVWDYYSFISKLDNLYNKQIDKEFTAALESKLSED